MKRTIVTATILAVGLCGVARAEGKDPEGKTLFLKYKCSSCHAVEAAGITKKAPAAAEGEEATPQRKPPDLSGVGLERKPEWIVLFLQKKEKLDGALHIKKFRGTDEELKAVADWLGTMKTAKKGKGAEKAAAPKPEANEAPGAEKADSSAAH